MKKLTVSSLILLLTAVWFTQDSRAQDYLRWSLPEGARLRLGKGNVRDVAWSPDGTRLAVGTSPGIWLYDADTGSEVSLLTGHTRRLHSMVFSPDGTTLASAGLDGRLRLWDVATGQERSSIRAHPRSVLSVAFSPDGTTLASDSYDHRVRVWDVATGQEKSSLGGHTRAVEAVAYSPDGLTLASARNGTLRCELWDVASRAGKTHAYRTCPCSVLVGGSFRQMV